MPAILTEELPVTPVATRNIRKTVLSNGLLVLTESMPHVRSVSMGAWIGTGSRDETAPLNGISHFVEHMVFKGTTSRSAQEFAREVDTIGGNLDAFTGKEMVCFSLKVLDEKVPTALDLLSDLVLHPTFTPDDISREQGVILEEIKMDEDNPDYLVHELFTQNFWKNDALGRPILGTTKTVPTFDQVTLFDFYNERFTPRNMVFSAAGNLDHDEFVDQVASHFGSLAASKGELPAALPAPVAHHFEAEEIARTGSALPRRSGFAGQRSRSLRRLFAQHDAGWRHEFAAVPVDPRRTGPRLLDLLRDESLP
jgi:predicted Zn-dependent peptidase